MPYQPRGRRVDLGEDDRGTVVVGALVRDDRRVLEPLEGAQGQAYPVTLVSDVIEILTRGDVPGKAVAASDFERATQQDGLGDDRQIDRPGQGSQVVVPQLAGDIAAELVLRQLRRDHDVAAVGDAPKRHALRSAQDLDVGEIEELTQGEAGDRHFVEIGDDRREHGAEGEALAADGVSQIVPVRD